jgi:hypothetical protein
VVAKTLGLGRENPREFWTEKVRKWQRSGKTQAAFCRVEGLNPNSFHGWKQALLSGKSQKSGFEQKTAATSAIGKPADTKHSFLRFPILDSAVDETPPDKPELEKSKHVELRMSLAAELIDAGNGRRIRIFNGADQSTVAALLSAFSSASSGF